MYVDRRRKLVSYLEYSSSSLLFLLSNIESNNDLFDVCLESLLAVERGFTFNHMNERARSILWTIASRSRDFSQLILTSWLCQHELVDILHRCQILLLNQQIISIDKALGYLFDDEHIRCPMIDNVKTIIGTNKLVLNRINRWIIDRIV
jgi:hypothetical protein